MENEKYDERNFGLDVFRILCCVGVLVYHVADDTFLYIRGGVAEFTKSKLLYFLAAYCVPGFFLLSGYFFQNKKCVSFDYVECKIKATMKKFLGWTILFVVAHFAINGKLFSIFEQFEKAFVSGGIMAVGWFLFTYSFILILAYPVRILFSKFGIVVCIFSFFLLACLSVFGKNLFVRTQSLWIELYSIYFVVGMSISFLEKKSNRRKSNFFTLVYFLIFALSTIFYISKFKNTSQAPHTFYGKWYYSIYLLSLFAFCKNLKIKNSKLKMATSAFSKNTMTVYMFHLPFLLCITQKYKVKNAKDVVLVVMILFLSSQFVAEIFKRFPLLRKLV